MPATRALLIDDHTLVRKGMEELLRSRGVEVVAAVGTGEEGVNRALALQPDIILLDIRMPIMNGIETLTRLRECGVTAPVLMLTMSRDDADLRAALRGGAQGYLLKDMDPEDLVPALEAVLRGESIVAKEMIGSLARMVKDEPTDAIPVATPFADLTAREQEILLHVAEGQSNKMIARALNITDGTVKLHVKSVLRKLGLRSRVEAAVLAVEHGMGRKKTAEK